MSSRRLRVLLPLVVAGVVSACGGQGAPSLGPDAAVATSPQVGAAGGATDGGAGSGGQSGSAEQGIASGSSPGGSSPTGGGAARPGAPAGGAAGGVGGAAQARPGGPSDVQVFEQTGLPLAEFRDFVAGKCGSGASAHCHVAVATVENRKDGVDQEKCTVTHFVLSPDPVTVGDKQFLVEGTAVKVTLDCTDVSGGGSTDSGSTGSGSSGSGSTDTGSSGGTAGQTSSGGTAGQTSSGQTSSGTSSAP